MVFFFLDESLLDDLLDELFLDEVVFEPDDFFLALGFFEPVALGVEDLLDDFLEDFCFDFGFDLGSDWATDGDAKQIASRIARRVFIAKLRLGRVGKCLTRQSFLFTVRFIIKLNRCVHTLLEGDSSDNP